jgi:hypothetical protein
MARRPASDPTTRHPSQLLALAGTASESHITAAACCTHDDTERNDPHGIR